MNRFFVFNEHHSLDLFQVVVVVVVFEVDFVFLDEIHLRMFEHIAQVNKSFPKRIVHRIESVLKYLPLRYNFAF